MECRNYTQLVDIINSLCSSAIEETAKEAQEKLHEYILEQYYNDPEFYPSLYVRTGTFLDSALSEMITNTSAEIYIDVDGMYYKNGFSPEKVVEFASKSQHGAEYFQTSTEPFWTAFIGWCDENLLKILKTNLIKNGISIK